MPRPDRSLGTNRYMKASTDGKPKAQRAPRATLDGVAIARWAIIAMVVLVAVRLALSWLLLHGWLS